MSKNEVNVYKLLRQYIGIAYPELIPLLHFDLSGVNNSSPYTRNLYSQLNEKAWPDLFIAKPRRSPDSANYCGFFLEIKDDGCFVYKKDGSLKKNEHTERQAEKIELLRQQGYYANFAIGFGDCKEQLDAYISGNI